MSELLEDYQVTKAALAEIQAKLEQLKVDPKLKRFLEFETKLRALMGEYSVSLVDINRLLDPSYTKPEKPVTVPSPTSAKPGPKKGKQVSNGKNYNGPRNGEANRQRAYRPRTTTTYRNPHTGEVITHAGGPHAQLASWREKWGRGVVDTWGVKNRPPMPEVPAESEDAA